MSNDSDTRREGCGKSSTVKKLVQAAAFASVLVPLGAVVAEAGPIAINCVTSETSGGSGGCFGATGDYSSGGNESFVWKFHSDGEFGDFDPEDLIYSLEITLKPTSTFSLNVTDTVFHEEDTETADLSAFPGATCIPMFDADHCSIFNVAVWEGEASWLGRYYMEMRWFINEDEDSQPPDDGRNHILQAPDGFTFTGALRRSQYDPLPDPNDPNDPALGGRGDSFSGFLGARADIVEPIPEPATLLLLGTGLATALYRRRRHDS